MSLADQLAYCSAVDLANRIRARALSPVEVIDSIIERIQERNSSLNAFVYFGFADAQRNAQEAERAVIAGDPLGPLHGVPVALKDNFDFKPGWKTTFGGVRALKDFTASFYCPFAERIEKAGAILIGKTNSTSFGFRGTTDNYLFGPTRNPFNLAKNAGGSSGGSAAAVADGMVPLAEGADAGGSIRIPASWCSVFGFKPSYGRVPFFGRPNAFASLSPFLSEGPITRTVQDAAVALTALSGYDSRDPFSLPDKCDFSTAHLEGIKGWKIAFSPNFDVFTIAHPVSAVIRDAVSALENAGAIVEEVKLGIHRSSEELGNLHHRSMMPLYLPAFESFEKNGIDLLRDHRQDFPLELLKWVDGFKQSTLDFYRDQEVRTEIYDAVQGVLNTYDLLVTPTLACLPVDNAEDGNTIGPSEINGISIDPMLGWVLTYFLNFSGHPAASVPAGLTTDNLPVGMQIIGKRYGDADVLTASGVLERVRPWQHHYSICAQRKL